MDSPLKLPRSQLESNSAGRSLPTADHAAILHSTDDRRGEIHSYSSRRRRPVSRHT